MKTFAILSALKAGLDVIEGSSVGASFGATAELEVGDVAQPAYDYVDVSWNTLLAGSVTLVGLGFLLDAAAGLEDLLLNLLLVIAVFAAGVSIFRPQARHLRGWLRDLLSVSMVVWLALAFVLPFSVLGASHLSARITAASIQEAEDGFSSIQAELFPPDTFAGSGWTKKIKVLQGQMEHIATTLKERGEDFMLWTVKIIAGYLFDCILFPLLLFVLLLHLTRSAVTYLFHKNLHRSLCDDLEARWSKR